MDELTQVQTRLGSLAVRVRGEGPTAVLWHSLFVDERSWRRVEEALGRDRRLVIVTGPGHGASPDPGRRYSLDDCAAAAGDILEALAIAEPVDWVGNAWGGHVGVVFASEWPDRCRTLVTLGTPIQAYGRSARMTFRSLLVVYRFVGMVGFLSSGIVDALLSPRTRANDPEAVALVLDSLRSMRRRALGNAMESISLRRPDLSERLAAISCPTLFVTGSRSLGMDGGAGHGEVPSPRHRLRGGRPRYRLSDAARGTRGDHPAGAAAVGGHARGSVSQTTPRRLPAIRPDLAPQATMPSRGPRADVLQVGYRWSPSPLTQPLPRVAARAEHAGRAGRGSPPRTSGSGWSAASWPGRTPCASRCHPGQVQPCTATHSSTVRFASRRQAEVRRTITPAGRSPFVNPRSASPRRSRGRARPPR